jgi:hypothetical protein
MDGETKRTSEVGRQKNIIQIDRTDINKGFKGRKGNNIYEVRYIYRGKDKKYIKDKRDR